MPKKRFSEAQVMRLPKTRRANYLAERRSKDIEQTQHHAEAIDKHLERAFLGKNPEKELSKIVWTSSLDRLFKDLAYGRQIALKCKMPSLDRCRDEVQFNALKLDLMNAGVLFVDDDLRHNTEYRAERIAEWKKKVNPYPKTKAGQELRQSLELLKQDDGEIREIGKRVLGLPAAGDPS